MATIWDTIHTNFTNCIEDGVTGVNSLSSVSIAFSESQDAIDLRTVAGSIIDGKYSLQLDNINAVREDISTGVVDFDYNIRLQIALELNINDKSTYHTAVQNLEELIRKRLDYDTWKDTSIVNIEFVVGNRFEFIPIQDTERFSIVEVVFRVVGRTNLNS